jgi:hypothetical protein
MTGVPGCTYFRGYPGVERETFPEPGPAGRFPHHLIGHFSTSASLAGSAYPLAWEPRGLARLRKFLFACFLPLPINMMTVSE